MTIERSFAADRLNISDVRGTLLLGLAVLLALAGMALGAAVTMRQVRVSREGQFIDLFNTALDRFRAEPGP
ncbi:hypothetical protein [Nonomuraea sp. NPDC003201]